VTLRTEREGAAVVLTLDRPAVHNALDERLARSLVDAIATASADDGVRGVVVTGAGDRTFTSGGDLNMLAELVRDRARGHDVIAMGDALAGAIEGAEVPVIAAVQGDAFGGGCELLLLCDLVIAESHARLGFRHAKMGLSPAWGGLTRLIERAGPLEASRMLLTAEEIDAAEALRTGLVNEVVPKGSSRARAVARIARIAENGRRPVASLKRTLREVREVRRAGAQEIERASFAARWGGPDHLAALQAFTTKKAR
jgi:enoyl-CoA hydratase